MRTFHIFAGTHKAGSTALQKFFADNVEPLDDLGLRIVRAGRTAAGHRDLARAIADAGKIEAGGSALLEALASELAASAQADHNAVAASELFGDIVDKPGVIDTLLGLTRTAGLELHLILFVRPQGPYFTSRYAQLVKQLRCAQSFDEFVESQLLVHRFDFDAHFSWLVGDDRFAATFVPFDAQLQARGVCITALGLLGVESTDAALAEPERVNEIPGVRTVEALVDLQRRRPEIGAMAPSARRAEAIAANAAAERADYNVDRFDGLTPALAARVRAHYAEANDRFAQLAWGKRWTEVFPAG